MHFFTPDALSDYILSALCALYTDRCNRIDRQLGTILSSTERLECLLQHSKLLVVNLSSPKAARLSPELIELATWLALGRLKAYLLNLVHRQPRPEMQNVAHFHGLLTPQAAQTRDNAQHNAHAE